MFLDYLSFGLFELHMYDDVCSCQESESKQAPGSSRRSRYHCDNQRGAHCQLLPGPVPGPLVRESDPNIHYVIAASFRRKHTSSLQARSACQFFCACGSGQVLGEIVQALRIQEALA